MPDRLTVYLDLKSPYAFLAIEPTRRLARRCGVQLDWLPYTLDIPSYLGSATVDETGRIIAEDRSEHQWRRVRYAYMDVRRIARMRGMIVRGTRKIWDTRGASIAHLWARAQHRTDAWLDHAFPAFWKRALDVEDQSVLGTTLQAAGVDVQGFDDWAAGPGIDEHDQIRTAAENQGVFGVPWFVWENEVFWGREALPLLAHRITGVAPGYAADLGLVPDDGA